MKTQKIHLEQLLGKLVRDPEGARAGRIFSIRAEQEGEDCVVRDYDLGAAALLLNLGISIPRLTGPRGEPRRVPWDQLDLSGPEHPRLRCLLSELGAKRR